MRSVRNIDNSIFLAFVKALKAARIRFPRPRVLCAVIEKASGDFDLQIP